jgi:hypothetical protein
MGMVTADCKGGTAGIDEIQHYILVERVLGMGKEPGFDTGPFRDASINVSWPSNFVRVSIIPVKMADSSEH